MFCTMMGSFLEWPDLLMVHIQCLLRVDGSILASVFLTSFFCVVPESPYSSNAASSSLLVAWYLNCFSTASSMHQVNSGFRNWRLFSSIDPYAVVSATHRQTVAVMVSYDSIICDLCGDRLQSFR